VAINNYATLVAAIAEWLARSDLTARIPDFVTLAEAKINRVLLHPRMETRTTVTVDTGATSPEFLDLPSDFQTMRSVRLSGVLGQAAPWVHVADADRGLSLQHRQRDGSARLFFDCRL
jgi:hypothetical protein